MANGTLTCSRAWCPWHSWDLLSTWYATSDFHEQPSYRSHANAHQGLRFLQASLSQERYLDETRAKVQELERELELLRELRNSVDRSKAVAIAAEENMKSRGWLW